MDGALLSIVLIVFLFLLLATGLWVALTLALVGVLGIALSSQASPGAVFATSVWGASSSWTLTALPLFIWMGEILFRTRLSADMFAGLAPWLGRLPGRLLHVNVIGSGIFAAVSGSSLATAATIGRMSLPELNKRGYDPYMSIGSLAGSGTLGLMIPPSIIMIVYGVAAEQSIPKLFIAGVLPGIALVILFSGYIALWALLNPSKVPPDDLKVSLKTKIVSTLRLMPIISLIIAVIGSIYLGIATATEAAAVGVLGSLILAALSGALTWSSLSDSIMSAMKTSCMIALILSCAAFLGLAMDYSGVPRLLAEWITGMNLSPVHLIAYLTILFIILGCFIDGISIVVIVSSIILPAIKLAGIDLIWFGIYLVLVVEMSLITPPVGMNLFLLQGMTGKSLAFVSRASFPFFILLVLAVALLWYVPEVATWLPSKMMS
ncbi:DctQ TRAP-type C4-dicarboxylate transport system, large permease component [Burkholderiaceae bacterium]